MLYLFRENIEKKIKEFVVGGGHFVMTYWSGIVNQSDLCFLGETPHQLTDVLGLRRTEIDALYDHETNHIIPTTESGFTKSYESKYLCDLLELRTAVPLFTYQDEFYADTAAVTVNEFGKGKAYYLATDANEEFYFDFYRQLLPKALVYPLIEGDIPLGLTVSSRETDTEKYIFIQNFNNASTDISSLKIEGEIIYGSSDDKMEPYSTIILKK
jgi:beta-galactosidase